jgi:nicotinamide phosphoribosyltransferase
MAEKMDWLNNICWLTDSYKVSHYRQYPPETKQVYSYFESRSGSVYPQTVFFGLQYWLKCYLAGPVVTHKKIDDAEELFDLHFGGRVFNRAGWEHILYKHGGQLPIEIKAAQEGSVVGESNVLMTVENTDPAAYWLTNYLETLLVQVWYPSTVATQGRAMKELLLSALETTGDPNLIGSKLHDFGFRGVTCPEQAALGGAAHLVNFRGTDNIAGVCLLREYYGERMGGVSIPAAEHSTITAWGKKHEVDAMRNMLVQYPSGMVACVSDSFDIFRACSEYWGTILKHEILARDGVLVVRPDSGDPPTIVVKVLQLLGEKFGYTTNSKGFRVLHPKIRVIQGDGIDYQMLAKILEFMIQSGWSADNIAFGSGGGLLQKLHRDVQRFAFKCSAVKVGNEEREVFKQPITDNGKKSKSGRLKLVWRDGAEGSELTTVPAADPREDQLKTVFLNGQLMRNLDFTEVRAKNDALLPQHR